MDDVSWGGCSWGRVPARNRAGLGTVVGYGNPRRRSNTSGVGRVFPGARVLGFGECKREGSQVRGEGRGAAASWLTSASPNPPVSSLLDQHQESQELTCLASQHSPFFWV